MAKKTEAINMDDIVLDDRCQTRAALNPEAVQEYADIYKEGEVDLPALDVVDIDGKMILIDGFHRLAGARQADHSFVRVTIVEECDIGRALWLASAVNQGHGVRRTNADKQRAVRLALDGNGEPQSARVIADHVGVHHSTVSRIREEWEAEQKALAKSDNAPATVKAKDGRQVPKHRRKSPPDTASVAQEADETPDTSTAEPSSLERAQAIAEIADIASQLHKVVKKAHAVVKDMSAGEFPDIEELADDVLDAAKVLTAAAAAVRKEEEGEERIAS
jgi:transposase-like protein